MKSVRVVDSHTEGEPTRTVLDGGPDLGNGTIAERVETFRAQHDRFRSALVNEPRGSDVMVGALLVPPTETSCATGVIFFNNVGYLGMCGHGTIGVVKTLAHLGRLERGEHRIETSAGIVTVVLQDDDCVAVTNVASFRKAKDAVCEVDGIGRVSGDVAWGGNWFYLVDAQTMQLSLDHVDTLTDYTWRVRQAINAQGYPEVDHVELFGAAHSAQAHSRNFVLCPGKAYDRSPCGTGTSAKLACLAADGQLGAGDAWIQEGILGSAFHASYQRDGEHIIPTIRGNAYVTGEATLLLDERDPFCWGIRL
jgi:4-hydroxyproline epimerase